MKIGPLAFILMCTSFAFGQSISLDAFDKIMVSHRINLHLMEGDHEDLRFEFENIDADKIRYDVSNKRLSIYLEGARLTEPRERIENYRKSIYSGGQVHAYVTYRSLRKLVVRGEETVVCETPIDIEKFTLRMYGEA
ncbi:MAG: DUF2807 domain-containing protein, partial [Saprospiraceae bacterium]|nr:DUF2807 domain-containing protein [Saprospiraceae bacterium]